MGGSQKSRAGLGVAEVEGRGALTDHGRGVPEGEWTGLGGC